MPAGVEDGILKRLYKFKSGAEISNLERRRLAGTHETRRRDARRTRGLRPTFLAAGQSSNSALKAQEILAERYGVSAGCLERDELQTASY